MERCTFLAFLMTVVVFFSQKQYGRAETHFINVARDTQTHASSQYISFSSDYGVDGILKWNSIEGQGVHTQYEDKPWWRTDLGRPYYLWRMKLYNRNDGTGYSENRITGFSIYVTSGLDPAELNNGSLCYKDGNGQGLYVYDITCSSPMEGTYVTIQLNKREYLNFCELEVYICENKWYGLDCNKSCTQRNCQNISAACDITGTCGDDQCLNDSYSKPCSTGCSDGWFKEDCTSQCPVNCLKCTRLHGYCLDCVDDRYNPGIQCANRCKDRHCKSPADQCPYHGNCSSGCIDGWYGIDCSKKCPFNNCARCERHDGTCLECVDGYFSQTCDRQCPPHCEGHRCMMSIGVCLGCANGYTGFFCNKTCSEFCAENQHNTRQCDMLGKCKNCIAGKFGKYCNSSCSSNCLNSVCHQEEASCMQGCVDGFEGRMCDIEKTDTNVLTIVLSVVLPSIAVSVTVAVILYKMRKMKAKSSGNSTGLQTGDVQMVSSVYENEDVEDGHVYDICDNATKESGIRIEEVWNYIPNKTIEDGFHKECKNE